MIEQLKAAYTLHRWVKLVVCAGLFASCFVLFRLSGGFPPWAWRFLAQVLPLLPRLWALHGPGILAPLAALLLLSVTLLLLWVVLIGAVIAVIRHLWQRTSTPTRQADSVATQDLFYSAETIPHPRLPLQQPETWEVRAAPRQPVYTYSPTPVSPLASVNGTYAPPAAYQTREYATQRPSLPLVPDITGQQPGFAARSALYEQPTADSIIPDVQKQPLESTFRLIVGSGSDPGITRGNDPNEDSILTLQGTCSSNAESQPFCLVALADGMGGHSKGQEASRLAIKTVNDIVLPAVLNNIEDEEQFTELLAEGAQHANLALHQRNQQQGPNVFMGTTLNAALIVGTTAYIANVGDSRTYLYRKTDGLCQITRDHSTVARLVEEKAIAPEDIYTHPKRNEIYRCLGEHASVKTDVFTVPLLADDTLLLCSDGLWEMVRDPDIQDILASSGRHPSQASAQLIQAALNRGGKDNVSVIVVYVARAY